MAAEKDVSLMPAERALSAEEWHTALASTQTPAGRRVQVGPRDTLWSIARVHRPSNNITIKQAMLAIRDANPHAFPSRNINEMEAGSHLIIPSAAAMRSRTAAQAEEEVRRQNQLWVAGRAAEPAPATSRRPPATAQSASAPSTPATSVAAQPAPAASPQPSLQLSAAAAAEATELRATQQRLNAVEEELQGVERERDELAERLADMQQQVNTLQSLIRLKDDQLSDLEQQLLDRPQVIVEVPAPQAQSVSSPPVAAPPQGLEAVKAQPLPYALAGGLGLVTLLLLWGLLSARRRLAQAEQAAQVAQEKHKTLEEDLLAAHNATSSDFDLDVHAHPLNELDGLETSEELQDLVVDHDLEETVPAYREPALSAEQPVDPLIEAESLIAYGRLEQAAQLLEAAVEAQPQREDLRLKLLEVLVELDEPSRFNQQHQALLQTGASALALNKAEDLARLMIRAQAQPDLMESDTSDVDELDLGEFAFDESDLDVVDLDVSDLEEASTPQNLETPDQNQADFGESNLDDLDLGEQDLGEVNLDELDLDEFDLSELEVQPLESSDQPAAPVAAPVQPDLSADDELDLMLAATQEGAGAQIDSESVASPPADAEGLQDFETTDFDFDLDLDQPLEEQELESDLVDIAAFDPVQPNNEADDFLSALDGLEVDEVSPNVAEPAPMPSPVDTDLSALSEELSELESLMIHEDLQGADDLVDLDSPVEPEKNSPSSHDLQAPDQQVEFTSSLPEPDWNEEFTADQLDGLDALGDLDDLDFAAEESEWTTQLDLATAYIEMGDKQGARDILEKIVELADPDHAATAQQMLEQLG